MGKARGSDATAFWDRYSTLTSKDLPVVEATGIPQSSISSWRNAKGGPIYPPADRAVLIARKLETTVEWLVDGDPAHKVRPGPMNEHIQDIIEMVTDLDESRLAVLKSLLSDMTAQARKAMPSSKQIIATA